MIKINLRFFGEDGLLGKKLQISITDDSGNVLQKFPEILKWSVEEITEESKKYPLNELDEHRTIHQQGFKGSIEGEDINEAYDTIVDKKIEFQDRTGGTCKFAIFTTKIYKDGTTQKYKYPNVTFDGFSQSADGNNKAITNKLNWQSTNRQRI